MGSDSLEDFFEDLHVFVEGGGVDCDVIDVNMHDFPNHISKDIVHCMLESGRCIAESKGHAGVFVMSVRGDKC